MEQWVHAGGRDEARGVKLALWVVVVLLVVVMFYQGTHRDAQLEAAKARADSLQQVSDSLDMTHYEDSLAAARVVERLADSVRRAEVAVRRARTRGDSLARAIATTPDTLIPKGVVLEALAAKDSVVAAQSVQIGALSADTAAWRVRWAQVSEEGRSWRIVALRAQQELSAALKRDRPRWGCTGGASATVALAGGSGAGFGVTCGRHL